MPGPHGTTPTLPPAPTSGAPAAAAPAAAPPAAATAPVAVLPAAAPSARATAVYALAAASAPLAAASVSPFAAPEASEDAASEAMPMPAKMVHYIQKLESWALANEQDSKRDALKLWSLKLPAIVAAGVSGVLGSQFGATVSIMAGLVGAIFVACDGIVRPGKMRGVHVLAFHDLRNLENSIENEWDISGLRHRQSDSFAADILERAEKQRMKIAGYLRQAEGSSPPDTPNK